MLFLFCLAIAVAVITIALKLIWRWVPTYFLFVGAGLTLHLLAIIGADPSEKKKYAFVAVFWGGVYLMCILGLALVRRHRL